MRTEQYISQQIEPRRGLISGYIDFLRDRRESTALKLAPYLLAGGSPEVAFSNLIPGAGEIEDVSALAVTTYVAVLTLHHINKRHR